MAAKNGYLKVIEVLQENQQVMRVSIDEQTKTLSALTERIAVAHDRLYGPDGAILRLTNSVTNLGQSLTAELEKENLYCRTDRAVLAERIDKVENRSTWITASAGGFGTAIGLFSKYLFSKIMGY